MAADKTLVPILKQRRLELLKELHAIDILLSANGVSNPEVSQKGATKSSPAKITTTVYEGNQLGYHSTRDENIAQLKEKTDAVTWKNYVLKAVQLLAPVNSDGIVDLINDANDHKIAHDRVRDATSAALRDLADEKKIGKKRGRHKNGPMYYAIE